MKPVRMLYYNITITFASLVVAMLIGGIEALALIADKLDLKRGFWGLIGAASDNFGLLGYAVIGLFVVSWLVSVLFYKLKRYDDMPVNLG